MAQKKFEVKIWHILIIIAAILLWQGGFLGAIQPTETVEERFNVPYDVETQLGGVPFGIGEKASPLFALTVVGPATYNPGDEVELRFTHVSWAVVCMSPTAHYDLYQAGVLKYPLSESLYDTLGGLGIPGTNYNFDIPTYFNTGVGTSLGPYGAVSYLTCEDSISEFESNNVCSDGLCAEYRAGNTRISNFDVDDYLFELVDPAAEEPVPEPDPIVDPDCVPTDTCVVVKCYNENPWCYNNCDGGAPDHKTVSCGADEHCSNGACVANTPGEEPTPTPIPEPVPEPSVGGPRVVIQEVEVLNSLEDKNDLVNPGKTVYLAVDVENIGDAVEDDLNMEVAVYQLDAIGKFFPDLGFTAAVLGRVGISPIATCKGEPFVTAVRLESMAAGGTARWVIPVNAPDIGQIIAGLNAENAYIGEGRYVVVAGLYKKCGEGYSNGWPDEGKISEGEFKYTFVTITEDDLVTHKAWYGKDVSCIEVLGEAEDECDIIATHGEDISGTCVTPLTFKFDTRCSVPLTKEDIQKLEIMAESERNALIESAFCDEKANCLPYPSAEVSCLSEYGIKLETGVNVAKGWLEVWEAVLPGFEEFGICYADIPEEEEPLFDWEALGISKDTLIIGGVVLVLAVVAIMLLKGRRRY